SGFACFEGSNGTIPSSSAGRAERQTLHREKWAVPSANPRTSQIGIFSKSGILSCPKNAPACMGETTHYQLYGRFCRSHGAAQRLFGGSTCNIGAIERRTSPGGSPKFRRSHPLLVSGRIEREAA